MRSRHCIVLKYQVPIRKIWQELVDQVPVCFLARPSLYQGCFSGRRSLRPYLLSFLSQSQGDLKLLDLGLAKVVTKSEMMDTVYHLTGGMGSYRYMAPEVYQCNCLYVS